MLPNATPSLSVTSRVLFRPAGGGGVGIVGAVGAKRKLVLCDRAETALARGLFVKSGCAATDEIDAVLDAAVDASDSRAAPDHPVSPISSTGVDAPILRADFERTRDARATPGVKDVRAPAPSSIPRDESRRNDALGSGFMNSCAGVAESVTSAASGSACCLTLGIPFFCTRRLMITTTALSSNSSSNAVTETPAIRGVEGAELADVLSTCGRLVSHTQEFGVFAAAAPCGTTSSDCVTLADSTVIFDASGTLPVTAAAIENAGNKTLCDVECVTL